MWGKQLRDFLTFIIITVIMISFWNRKPARQTRGTPFKTGFLQPTLCVGFQRGSVTCRYADFNVKQIEFPRQETRCVWTRVTLFFFLCKHFQHLHRSVSEETSGYLFVVRRLLSSAGMTRFSTGDRRVMTHAAVLWLCALLFFPPVNNGHYLRGVTLKKKCTSKVKYLMFSVVGSGAAVGFVCF